MPFTLKISCCPNGHEFTIYAKPIADDEIDLIWNCEECARQAAEKPEASELRSDETVGGRRNEPSNVVRTQERPRPHYVYELIDSRDGSVFYIGITMNQNGRYYEHGAPNSDSAAFPRIQEIKNDGGEYDMQIVASFSDRRRAEAYETILISQSTGLVNRRKTGLRSIES